MNADVLVIGAGAGGLCAAARLAHPHITAELTLGDYGSHANVLEPFIAFTRERLAHG